MLFPSQDMVPLLIIAALLAISVEALLVRVPRRRAEGDASTAARSVSAESLVKKESAIISFL